MIGTAFLPLFMYTKMTDVLDVLSENLKCDFFKVRIHAEDFMIGRMIHLVVSQIKV